MSALRFMLILSSVDCITLWDKMVLSAEKILNIKVSPTFVAQQKNFLVGILKRDMLLQHHNNRWVHNMNIEVMKRYLVWFQMLCQLESWSEDIAFMYDCVKL